MLKKWKRDYTFCIIMATSFAVIGFVAWYSVEEIHYLKRFYQEPFSVEEIYYASFVELIKVALIAFPFIFLTIFSYMFLTKRGGKNS